MNVPVSREIFRITSIFHNFCLLSHTVSYGMYYAFFPEIGLIIAFWLSFWARYINIPFYILNPIYKQTTTIYSVMILFIFQLI